MFNLVNGGLSAPAYINEVIAEVARVTKEAKQEAEKTKKRVSVKLVHEVKFVNGNIRSSAHLRFNTTFDLPSGKVDCESMTLPLEDGETYSHGVINQVVEDCAGVVNEWISMSVICGNELSADDINHEFQRRLDMGLHSAGVNDHIGASVVSFAGGIDSVTITVV